MGTGKRLSSSHHRSGGVRLEAGRRKAAISTLVGKPKVFGPPDDAEPWFCNGSDRDAPIQARTLPGPYPEPSAWERCPHTGEDTPPPDSTRGIRDSDAPIQARTLLSEDAGRTGRYRCPHTGEDTPRISPFAPTSTGMPRTGEDTPPRPLNPTADCPFPVA